MRRITNYGIIDRLAGTSASTGLIQNYSYNSVNQMTAWSAVGSDGVESLNLNGLLSYNSQTGNIEQLKREFGIINNTYDVLDQLTGSQYISSMSAVSALDRSMQYDYNGNRVQDSILGTIKVSNNVPTQDHYYGYGYDSFSNQERVYKRSSGKTLRSITYRGDDLISSTQTSKVTAKYFYDALGRRVKKEITNAGGTFTQSFEYIGTTNQVLRAKSGDATQFVYLAGDSLGNYYGHATQNELKAYAKDHLGSVLNSDASPNKTYGSFGETQTTQKINVTTNPFISSFAMMSTDLESNLHATPNRMYDPNQGRWLTKDPIGFAGQDANLYRYVKNNPLGFVDPNGLASLTTNMQEGFTEFDPSPEAYGPPFRIPTRNDVGSKSLPGATDPFATTDVNWVQSGTNSPAYGPEGAYIDTSDPRGRDIHGGGSSINNWAAPYQGWAVTNGCTRGQNADIQMLGKTIDDFKKTFPDVRVPYTRK